MSETDLGTYLEKHPRMIGVLFTLFLLLSQAGVAIAGGSAGCTTCGP